MRLARGFAPLALAWASCGCTTVAVAITEEHSTAERMFERAIQVDLACITAPWLLVAEGPPVYDTDAALFLLYGSAVVAAYGLVDLPFTYAAYSLHRAQRREEDRRNGW